MKIGIDARMIASSGIGVYIRSLLEELLPIAKNHSFTLYGPRFLLEKLDFQHDNARIVHSEIPIYSIKEQLFHPAFKEKLDLLHIPHYNIPVFYKGRMVVTIHDINHLLMPQFLPNRMAYPYAKFMLHKAYHRANQVICVSQSTQKDLKEFFGQNGVNSQVIHESVRPEFLQKWSSDDLEKIRIRYRLPQNYILCVGILKPNKNLLALIRIFRNLRKEGFSKFHLVIVGKRFERHPEILVEIHKGEREGFIRHLEEVPSADLPGIYQMADLFSFISLYEGFGLPILEAFASRVPVLAANVSSIPEVAGKGAALINPYNEEQIKQALIKLLSDSGLRQNLALQGVRELSRFSWKKTAEETLKVYEKAAQK